MDPQLPLGDRPPELKNLYVENARRRLAKVPCPGCGTVGQFALFKNLNNNGVGIRCTACERGHPFMRWRIMWLPSIMNFSRRKKLR